MSGYWLAVDDLVDEAVRLLRRAIDGRVVTRPVGLWVMGEFHDAGTFGHAPPARVAERLSRTDVRTA